MLQALERVGAALAAFSHTHQFYGVFDSRTMGHKSFLGERGHLQAVEA
jgi:hypothetical protein